MLSKLIKEPTPPSISSVSNLPDIITLSFPFNTIESAKEGLLSPRKVEYIILDKFGLNFVKNPECSLLTFLLSAYELIGKSVELVLPTT